jgi:RNA polymerase sigma-70 factor (ECF subfamily)
MGRLRTSEAIEREIGALLATEDFAGAATAALKGYGPPILVYLRSVIRDDDLGDDAFSLFCEKLWRSIRDFRGEASFGTWAYRIAWCSLKDVERTRARRRESRLGTDAVSRIVQEIRTTTAAWARTEARDKWSKIKDSLAPDERSLLLLRIEQRLPWKDVAAIMAVEGEPAAETALRKRLERLNHKLRELAKSEGLR